MNTHANHAWRLEEEARFDAAAEALWLLGDDEETLHTRLRATIAAYARDTERWEPAPDGDAHASRPARSERSRVSRRTPGERASRAANRSRESPS